MMLYWCINAFLRRFFVYYSKEGKKKFLTKAMLVQIMIQSSNMFYYCNKFIRKTTIRLIYYDAKRKVNLVDGKGFDNVVCFWKVRP